MNDTNLYCKHRQVVRNEKEKVDFCKKCGCFLIIKYSPNQKEVESYAILPKKNITPLDISPYDTIQNVLKGVKDYSLSKYYQKIPEEYFERRRFLTDLLKEYIIEHNFGTRSYFLGIYILDYIHCKYSYNEVVSKLKPDLLVLGIFLVAVKFIDDDAYPPALDTFPSKKNPSIFYSLNEVRKYEFMVVKLIDFKLDFFTSYYITETILSHGVVFSHELEKMNINQVKVIKEKLKKMYRLALDINKMFIEDITCIKYNSLEISATCIMMSKELLKFECCWNKELEHLYKLEPSTLNSCYNSILKAYEKSEYNLNGNPSSNKEEYTKEVSRAASKYASSMNVVTNAKLSSVNNKDIEKKNNDDYNIDKNKNIKENSVKTNSINSIVNSTLNTNKNTGSTNNSNLSSVSAAKRISTKQVYNVKEVLNSKK